MVFNQNKHTGLSIIDKRGKIPDLLINSSIHYLFFPEEFHRKENKHREGIQNGKCLHFLHLEVLVSHRTFFNSFLTFKSFAVQNSPRILFFGGVLKS